MSIRASVLLSALATIVVCLLLAGPTFYWLDSSELVAAAWELGIAHAPGHPLASLLARLFCLLPIGTIAFRVTLACAACAAAASALVALLAHRLVDMVRGAAPEASLAETRPWHQQLAVLTAAVTAGWSYAVVFQAVRAEVYALNLLCVLGAAYLLLRSGQLRDPRYLIAAALVVGLGLCNHHLLVLLAFPAAFVFLLAGWRRKGDQRGSRHVRRAAVGVLIAGSLGLGTLAYLPLRAQHDPRVNWGAPTTVERFAWLVSARAFHQSLDRASKETVSHRAGGALFAVLGGLSPFGALLAAAGLYLAWRRRESRRAAALLTLLAAGNLLSPFLVGFDPFNPDAHGYLCVAVCTLAPGIAVFLVILIDQLRSHLPRLAPVALLVLLLPLLQLRGLAAADLSDHWAAEETGRAVLDVPSGALALTSYFETIFNAWALQSTADLRPDVAVVHRNFLAQPGYAASLGRRQPELASYLSRWHAQRRPLLADLRALARERAVRVEFDLNVDETLARALGPAGLLLALGDGIDATAASKRVAAWRAAVGPVSENETRRALTWTHYLLALHGCRYGPRPVGRAHLAAAQKLAPHSRQLTALAARCR